MFKWFYVLTSLLHTSQDTNFLPFNWLKGKSNATRLLNVYLHTLWHNMILAHAFHHKVITWRFPVVHYFVTC